MAKDSEAIAGKKHNGGAPPVVLVKKKHSCLALPDYESAGAAGMDLRAFVDNEINIPPMGRARIPTGLFIEVPEGYEAQVRPRSGLAYNNGITVLNSPGTIDSDYRGEVGVILINLSAESFTVKNGERVAQMIISPVTRAQVIEAELLSETKRGSGGFGSTGM